MIVIRLVELVSSGIVQELNKNLTQHYNDKHETIQAQWKMIYEALTYTPTPKCGRCGRAIPNDGRPLWLCDPCLMEGPENVRSS